MSDTRSTLEWGPGDHGPAPGAAGSERGVVVRHDEYWDGDHGAGLTIERDIPNGPAGSAAITCGVYGWMLHTRFFASMAEAQAAAELMRPVLAELVEAIVGGQISVEHPGTGWSDFVARFP